MRNYKFEKQQVSPITPNLPPGRGASGGSSWGYDQLGGYPVIVTATFRLGPGFLKVAVGQQGQCHKFDGLAGKKSKSVVCGGGGGTFVVSDNEPLLIAGGGGGAGDNGPGKLIYLFVSSLL